MKIEIELSSIEEAKNSFNSNILSEALDNYLTSSCEHLNYKDKEITLEIKCSLTKEEEKTIFNLIHNYYQEKEKIYYKIDIIDNYIRLIFSLIGIIAILISREFNFFLSELFLIAGWVIIWEIVYDILFKEIIRKKKRRIYKYLKDAKIIFIKQTK